jgi:hypothetical protein
MNAFLFEFVKKKCMMGVFEIIIRFGAAKKFQSNEQQMHSGLSGSCKNAKSQTSIEDAI